MNAKTNYTLVGLFVITSIIMIFVFVIWLVKPTNEKELTTYKIYFTESVSGLNVDSPVKYRGVTIGKVMKMQIHKENIEEIEVDISVDKDAPIKTDTEAKLKSQGITGLSYIDLSQGSKEAPYLCDKENGDRIIKSVPSFLVKIEESFGSVSLNLSKTLHETSVLLREENQEVITQSLKHFASVMQKIDEGLTPQSVKNFQLLVASLRATMQHLEATMPKVDQTLASTRDFEERSATALTSISNSYKIIASSMAVFEARNKNGDYSMKESTAEPMKQFGITMREMQRTLDEVNALLARYSDSPSNMLLQSEEPDIGPGEKK
jgi:phospholipid/cholesterol/gamma-HCH transport system substrate-binding protein